MARSHGTSRKTFLGLFLCSLVLILLLLPGGPTRGQGGSPTPAADSAGWRTYPDHHPWLTYGNGLWETFEVAGATGGTLTGTADLGATLTFTFEGTNLRLLYSKGPEGDNFTVQVDAWMIQVNNHANGYSHGHVAEFLPMEPGTHTVTVTNSDGATWIEAIQVQGSLLPSPAISPTPSPTPPPRNTPTVAQEADEFSREMTASATVVDVPNGDVATLEDALTNPNVETVRLFENGYYAVQTTTFVVAATQKTIEGRGATIEAIAPITPWVIQNGTIIIRDQTFYLNGFPNVGTYGGNMLVLGGEVYIYDSVFHLGGNNSVHAGQNVADGGGAIHNAAYLEIHRSEFHINGANGGGAIQNEGTLAAECVQFDFNTAQYGGAILNAGSGSTTIQYSRFDGNVATIWGGSAIYNYAGSPQVVATHNYWNGGVNPSTGDLLSGDIDYSNHLSNDPTVPGSPEYDAHCRQEPEPPECAITINSNPEDPVYLYTFEYISGEWPIALKIYLDRPVHRRIVEDNDEVFKFNHPYHESDIEAGVEGYRGYETASTMTNLEVDAFYLQRYFHIVHIRRVYLVEEGKYQDVDFWVYTGDGVAPHADNPPPNDPGNNSCFDELPIWPSRTDTIDLLAEYGVGIEEDGQNWTDYELRAILTGVMRVAEAYVEADVVGATHHERFRQVMGQEMIFLRLAETFSGSAEWGRYYSDSPDPFEDGLDAGYCRNFGPLNDGVLDHPRVIACRGALINSEASPPVVGEISEFTAVHELGHLFDSRTGDKLFPRMETPVGQIVISDCDNENSTVMGVYLREWKRGIRGWGSVGPTEGFSDFQQNPFAQSEASHKLRETAADMFLNWVYRLASDSPPSSDCDEPGVEGIWEGFRNINGAGDFNGPAFPGNQRYIWMHEQMLDLLTENNWR